MTTAEQKAAAQAMGLDLSKIDWAKMLAIVQTLLSLFQSPTPTMRAVKAGCEDQETACCECVCASAQALMAALKCHQSSCEG